MSAVLTGFVLAALGLVSVQLSTGVAPEMRVFAEPLGVWCDARLMFVVGLENVAPVPVFVAVPKASSTMFPYKSTATFDIGSTGGGAGSGCGCSDGGCELCASPESVVTVRPGERLAWTYEMEGPATGRGVGHAAITLFWYGGSNEQEARTRIATGTAEIMFDISNESGTCFVAHKQG
jgi:hypothetical protein